MGIGWFGVNSVARKLRVSHMEAQFGAAEGDLRHGRMQAAGRGYRGALQAWQQALKYGGYYPILSGEYLIAGNCYQQQRQPRTALKCYEEGLAHEPLSISLLSTLGGCAFRLGEYNKAFSALQKSRSIFPLPQNIRLLWKKLNEKNLMEKTGAERCVK